MVNATTPVSDGPPTNTNPVSDGSTNPVSDGPTIFGPRTQSLTGQQKNMIFWAVRLLMALTYLNVRSLTDMYCAQLQALSWHHFPAQPIPVESPFAMASPDTYGWKASPEAMWEIEALEDYVDALAQTGSTLYLYAALGGDEGPCTLAQNHGID